jgi:hypothetical protein
MTRKKSTKKKNVARETVKNARRRNAVDRATSTSRRKIERKSGKRKEVVAIDQNRRKNHESVHAPEITTEGVAVRMREKRIAERKEEVVNERKINAKTRAIKAVNAISAKVLSEGEQM